jgi:predicted ester cyclase
MVTRIQSNGSDGLTRSTANSRRTTGASFGHLARNPMEVTMASQLITPRSTPLHRWSSSIRLSLLGTLTLLLGLVALASPASAGPVLLPNADDGGSGSAASGQNRTVVRLFDEVFTQQNGEVCAELMTAGAQHQTPAGQFEGPDGFNAFAGIIWTAFPDAMFVVDEVSEADGTVAVRWSMTGTHLGQLDDQAASGNRVALHGLAYFLFDGDRITASWIEYDRLGLANQIAADPAELPPFCTDCHETPY